MARLALVLKEEKGNKSGVKVILPVLAILFCAFSCTPIDSRKAGGGAFDDSPVGQALDANAPLPEDNISGARSFEEWRERE